MSVVSPPRAGRREWAGLAVLTLPTLMASLELTIPNLALPAIAEELSPTSAQSLWMIDIYGFLLAGSLITMGTLGDRIGRRRLLLLGAAAFGLLSVAAAYASSAEVLIVIRALLGIAGATLMPTSLALVATMFVDPRQRTVAIGAVIAGVAGGTAVGPLIGGWILEHFWWGMVFLIGAPVAAVFMVIGRIVLPAARHPGAPPVDLVSAAMSLFAVLSLIAGLKTLVEGGRLALPAGGVVIGSSVAPLLSGRIRPGLVVSGGLAVSALGFAGLTRVTPTGGLPMLVTSAVVISLGLGAMMTLSTDLVVSAAPTERSGSASALSETAPELGGALGIAVLGTVGAAVFQGRLPPSAFAALPPSEAAAARDTLASAVAAAETLPRPAAAELLSVARQAFTDGLHLVASVSVGLLLVMGVAVALLVGRLPTNDEDGA